MRSGAARAKGLKSIRLHDLRHGYASLAFAAGIPLKVISKALGHSSIAITARIYCHLLPNAMAQKTATFDDFLQRAARGA